MYRDINDSSEPVNYKSSNLHHFHCLYLQLRQCMIADLSIFNSRVASAIELNSIIWFVPILKARIGLHLLSQVTNA